MFLNLNKPIISRIKIEDRVQQIEYESLPNICFSCGLYRHNKEACLVMKVAIDRQENSKNVFLPTLSHPNMDY